MIKKTKLTLSGIAKKSIESIELAKTQSKNSVVIRKKTNKSSLFEKSIIGPASVTIEKFVREIAGD